MDVPARPPKLRICLNMAETRLSTASKATKETARIKPPVAFVAFRALPRMLVIESFTQFA